MPLEIRLLVEKQSRSTQSWSYCSEECSFFSMCLWRINQNLGHHLTIDSTLWSSASIMYTFLLTNIYSLNWSFPDGVFSAWCPAMLPASHPVNDYYHDFNQLLLLTIIMASSCPVNHHSHDATTPQIKCNFSHIWLSKSTWTVTVQ